MATKLGTIEVLIAGPEGQFAAVGHGIAGVLQQVVDDLLQLQRVDLDGPQLRFALDRQGSVLAQQ
ncbi:hypothetical protein D3C80_2056740 [compost metagenome]